MKPFFKQCSIFLATALTGISIVPTLAASADESFYEAAVYTDETVSVSREAVLDYASNQWQMNYHLSNNGSSDAVCRIDVPVASTLDSEHGSLYTFSSPDEASLSTETWFTPLFSASNLSEDTVTAALLEESRSASTELPSDPGTLYTIHPDQASETAIPVLTVSSRTDDSCRIFPIGCSYTASGTTCQVSLNKEQTEGYLFVAGDSGKAFTAEELDSSGCEINAEEISLDSFIRMGCQLFLNQTPLPEPVDQTLLSGYLSAYLSASSVSLDLVSSLQWLIKQQLFEVYSCSVTVPANAEVTVSIVRNSELFVNGVSINPALTNSGTPLTENTIRIVLKDDYTRASLRNAKGSYDKESSVITLTDTSKGTYQVILGKTPIWEKSFHYIVPMSIVMVLFLAVCLISYLGRMKAKQQEEGTRRGNNPSKLQ